MSEEEKKEGEVKQDAQNTEEVSDEKLDDVAGGGCGRHVERPPVR